jgi:hypothetical protein
MIWPTIIVNNFFDEPEKIIDYSKTLKFHKDSKGSWPGERTNLMSSVNDKFFNWINYKIVRLIYPMTHSCMSWLARQYFQKVDGNIYENEGWIHVDAPSEFTAIIYLSKHKDCGTSLYSKKTYFDGTLNKDKKEEMYKTLNLKNGLKYLKQNNDLFEKNLTVNSKFNRLFLFDSNQFHAADKFKDNQNNDERLTLITFFDSLTANNIKYPIPEMKREY